MEEKKCLHCGLQEFEEYKQGPDAVIYSKVRKVLIKKRETLSYLFCVKCGTVNRNFLSR